MNESITLLVKLEKLCILYMWWHDVYGYMLKVKKRYVDTDNQKYAAFYTLRYTFSHHLCVKMIQFETVAEFTQKG